RRGIRHPLPAILGLAVLAMLTGCKSYQAIAQFGRDKGFALAQALGFRRGKTPTKATYSVLFRRLDVVAFESVLARWIASRLSEEELAVLALDGKTLRGSRDGELPGQHLVAAYAVGAAAVVAQVRVAAGGDYVFTVKDNQPSLAIDIQAGLRWEEQQRQSVAAFSPRRSARPTPSGQHGHDGEQGARPAGAADPAADDEPDEEPGLGGPEAGL